MSNRAITIDCIDTPGSLPQGTRLIIVEIPDSDASERILLGQIAILHDPAIWDDALGGVAPDVTAQTWYEAHHAD